ncbi:hypothetical protein niasHT_029384 [Heterodera trifolii]|uniref:Uncharacterized protein n=1 Tax=Heterodera trifolii TaxID=157864 RepID=A0ABD2J9U2_9BILA
MTAFVVLLCLVPPLAAFLFCFSGADSPLNYLKIKMTPSLAGDDQLEYIFQTSCPAPNPNEKPLFTTRDAELMVDGQYIIINVGTDAEKCRRPYKIAIAIVHNEQTKVADSKHLYYTWKPFTTHSPADLVGRTMQKFSITFGNYFKLVILPNLAPAAAAFSFTSNRKKAEVLYRVDVYCADDNQQTMVVLDKDTEQCRRVGSENANPEYKLRVWPIRREWIDVKNMLDQPELVVKVAIRNGEQYELRFPTYFTLFIWPEAEDGQVYYVEVQRHGHADQTEAAAKTFRTFTAHSALILLAAETEEESTKYDILVMQMDATDAADLSVSDCENERRESGVTIDNRGEHSFDFIIDDEDDEIQPMEMDEEEKADEVQQGEEEISILTTELANLSADFESFKDEMKILPTLVDDTKKAMKELDFIYSEFDKINEKIDKIKKERQMNKSGQINKSGQTSTKGVQTSTKGRQTNKGGQMSTPKKRRQTDKDGQTGTSKRGQMNTSKKSGKMST